MGRPPKALARDTRRAAMDAALTLFAQRGYSGAGLREIARMAGVREGALYHYFSSKDALLSAVLNENRENFLHVVASVEAPIEDVETFLLNVVRAVLADYRDPTELLVYRLFMQDGLRLSAEGRVALDERIGARMAFSERLLSRLLDEGHLPRVRRDLVNTQFFGALVLYRQLLAIVPDHPAVADPERYARGHVRFFLNGIRGGGFDDTSGDAK